MRRFEDEAKKKGFSLIIGVDEAGRGPLAGPVVAAAVALKTNKFRNTICDSKLITPPRREAAFHEIFQNAHVGIGISNETVIDALNILKATHFAMASAVHGLLQRLPSAKRKKNFQKRICLLIDGNSFQSDLPYTYKTIVRGDNRSLSIAAASIVAKVTRDRMLAVYDKIFPRYGFGQHKGYATLRHRRAIKKYGLSPIHRKTYHSAL